mmetsp:Transcript_13811/g.37639  ORF Transcript_13811/g.37639 Transcript_13811/m.37639 type:complete len:310 (+) Transcript_13811:150-1079(+)
MLDVFRNVRQATAVREVVVELDDAQARGQAAAGGVRPATGDAGVVRARLAPDRIDVDVPGSADLLHEGAAEDLEEEILPVPPVQADLRAAEHLDGDRGPLDVALDVHVEEVHLDLELAEDELGVVQPNLLVVEQHLGRHPDLRLQALRDAEGLFLPSGVPRAPVQNGVRAGGEEAHLQIVVPWHHGDVAAADHAGEQRALLGGHEVLLGVERLPPIDHVTELLLHLLPVAPPRGEPLVRHLVRHQPRQLAALAQAGDVRGMPRVGRQLDLVARRERRRQRGMAKERLLPHRPQVARPRQRAARSGREDV